MKRAALILFLNGIFPVIAQQGIARPVQVQRGPIITCAYFEGYSGAVEKWTYCRVAYFQYPNNFCFQGQFLPRIFGVIKWLPPNTTETVRTCETGL